MGDLQERTRFEPAEVEPRILAALAGAPASCIPSRRARAEENFSIAIPPPNVTGRAAHGPRAQRHDPGRARAHEPDARQAHEVDPRHRPRRHRHAAPGREAARVRGHVAHRARPRGVRRSASGSGARSTAARSSSSSSASARRCDYEDERFTLDAQYVRGGAEGLRRPLRAGPDLPRQLHGQLGSRACARRSPTSRSRSARASSTRCTRSPTRWRPARASSSSRPCARRRCSPTPPSRSIPTTSATRGLVGQEVVLPLVGRRLTIIADEYVKTDFGTGALKITPGHDPNDFEIGRRHGLEEIGVIGEDGLMTAAAGERYAGLTVADARERVVADLEALGAIRGARGVRPHRALQPALGRARRAADLAAVVHAHGRARRARDRRGALRPRQDPPRVAVAALRRLAGEHPPVVHLAPAVVGPPDPGLVPRRRDLRRRDAARGRGLGAGPRRARHVVLLGAVAVRDARLARATRPSCRRSIRPTCSRRGATSSFSGSRGW